MDKILFGAAYYDEYMPYDRLDTDIELMKSAGINVVRIAESTWSALEPQNGVFDFSSIDRVLKGMHKAGINVIVGTPTYAVPTWMVKEHPEILAITPQGQNKYGARQNMDITSPAYLFYAERVIRKLIKHVKDHPAVIGYQLDNETKQYNATGPNVQLLFVKYVKEKFGSLEELNSAFGLDYWSNRINSWEDFPSAEGSINASLSCEFSKFQRKLVTDFLTWQSSIVSEYKRNDQFVTHNFDFEWRGYSYGIQPDVDHFAAAEAVDIAGADIYHPSQDELTGCEISVCGDIARSMKRKNYFVLETESQGFAAWVPYPGQLRLQAFSHIASGANMVEYWNWHSIHNAIETYWKGLLSHDFEPNPTYNEARTIGMDLDRLGAKLINLEKKNSVAILFSNESLTSLNSFKMYTGGLDYNDCMRKLYDSLYRMNVGCDFVNTASDNIEEYQLIVVPPLYSAADDFLERLNKYVENGGHIVYAFRSGFCDENVKVRTSHQPGIIRKACGIYYSQFVEAKTTSLISDELNSGKAPVKLTSWMELITPGTAEVLAYYDHPHWGKYAAITQNSYGKGTASYIGCMPEDKIIDRVLERVIKNAGLWGADQQIAFPLITKSGINEAGKKLHYYFNYSPNTMSFSYPFGDGVELLADKLVNKDETIEIEPWGVCIIEENG